MFASLHKEPKGNYPLSWNLRISAPGRNPQTGVSNPGSLLGIYNLDFVITEGLLHRSSNIEAFAVQDIIVRVDPLTVDTNHIMDMVTG